MKESDVSQLRSIRWSELFPWLAIGRCFRLAIAPRMLVLGALGIVANLVGWWLLAWIFGGGGDVHPWFREATRPPQQLTAGPGSPIEAVNTRVPDAPGEIMYGWILNPYWFLGNLIAISYSFLEPFFALFSLHPLEWRERFMLILAALYSIAVWAYCGGALSRIAAVQLAGDEKLGIAAATRYARTKWLSYCAAPLFPLLGVALAAIPLWFAGVLQQANFGLLVTGAFWILALLCGFFMAILLAGLAYGWPLMWATISVEGTDSFDALSRTYAYVFQRPLRYGFYIVVAAVVGLLGMIVVNTFAAAVLWLTSWGASLGSGGARAQEIAVALSKNQISDNLNGFGGRAGLACIAFWRVLVKSLALGFTYSYFWTASTSIYLLLRRDVDATETDEVFLDADASEKAVPLPPITTDEAGAPQIATPETPPAIDGQPAQAEEPKAAE